VVVKPLGPGHQLRGAEVSDSENHERSRILRRMTDKIVLGESSVICGGRCWLYRGCLDRDGYGKLSLGRRGDKTMLAHRLIYELMVGPIPAGMTIDHRCRVRNCVNPRHLQVATWEDNCWFPWRLMSAEAEIGALMPY
jgi:hypothetical protein